MPIDSVLSFWVVAALLILVPGPDWAFTMRAGLRGEGLPAAAGIVLGYLTLTLLVATGLGLLVATTPGALTLLTLVGGVYLIWLGTRILRHPPTRLSGPPEPTPDPTGGGSGRDGPGVTLLQG